MDGNEKAEIAYLKQLSITFGAKMKASTCTKNEALYSFTASFLPALEYALPVTNISEAQWDTILAPALVPSLHKAGVRMVSYWASDILVTGRAYSSAGSNEAVKE